MAMGLVILDNSTEMYLKYSCGNQSQKFLSE